MPHSAEWPRVSGAFCVHLTNLSGFRGEDLYTSQKYRQRDPDDGWQLARGRPLMLTPAQYTRLKEQVINSYHECHPWTICDAH
jgi:hypothetical protein